MIFQMRGNKSEFGMERIAIIGDNSVEYLKILLDVWNSGNCAVLIDYHMPLEYLCDLMVECGITQCYIDEGLLKDNVFLDDRVLFRTYACESRNAQRIPDYIYNDFRENYSQDDAVILFSSGPP